MVSSSFASKSSVTILMLNIQNQSKDTRYDYMENLIKAILQFDFATINRLKLIDKTTLEKTLKEQEMMLSTLALEDAFKLAVSLKADYIITGKYRTVESEEGEEEVEITISLYETATQQPVNYIEQGRSENLIHAIAEQIVFRLSGKMEEFQSELYERSLLSLIDEKAGRISLHTTLKDAEVFLNGELVGITTGLLHTPLKIENLKPGSYVLQVHLDEFGVIKLPEVTFQDWQQEFEITPGKHYVVKANIEHFSYLLTDLIELVSEKLDLTLGGAKDNYHKTHEVLFQDRKGTEIKLTLQVAGSIESDRVTVKAKIVQQETEHEFEHTCVLGETASTTHKIGLVRLTITTDYKYKNRAALSYLLERTDISINMWKE
jgi:TolB-like protein